MAGEIGGSSISCPFDAAKFFIFWRAYYFVTAKTSGATSLSSGKQCSSMAVKIAKRLRLRRLRCSGTQPLHQLVTKHYFEKRSAKSDLTALTPATASRISFVGESIRHPLPISISAC